ncbi:hypothetical protein SEA_BANQUO_3 [Gordonia phage Banquo]|nr:hypothetical protein SEA_BANQUO_3 [Gordonia phage Banquo]
MSAYVWDGNSYRGVTDFAVGATAIQSVHVGMADGEYRELWRRYSLANLLVFSEPGEYSLLVEPWMRFVDLGLIGGGGGGGGHAANNLSSGQGGYAAQWAAGTASLADMIGGVLTIVVGAGGAGNNTNGGAGFDGGGSFVYGGTVGLWSDGGLGGRGSASGNSANGESSQPVQFGELVLPGAAGGSGGSASRSNPGGSPGAGGEAGRGGLINGRTDGAVGGDGRVIILPRSY